MPALCAVQAGLGLPVAPVADLGLLGLALPTTLLAAVLFGFLA